MIYQSPQNPNTHLSVKERQWPSFPAKQLFLQNRIQGEVLDFGCGLGLDVRFLGDKGFTVTGYDPFYQPTYPTQKFDTILCNYVLNILLPEEQAHVLMAVSELLKPSGRAYFTVRRDIKKNGFRTHVKHGCKIYQCNVILPYKSVLKADHCEIYEYQPITQLTPSPEIKCSFCQPLPQAELLTESATVYALLLNDSPTPGHTLIIPKHHHPDFLTLPPRLQQACWFVAGRARDLLKERVGLDDYTLSVTGGLSVSHTHLSLKPA